MSAALFASMGNAIALCLGSADAKRAAHDSGTDRLLTQFRRSQSETQHKVEIEEERLSQLTGEAKRLKLESEQAGPRNAALRSQLEKKAKEKLAQRKQVQEQLQRLQDSVAETSKMILRLESLRDSGPKANLYKDAKRQIEGYEKFMAVEDMGVIRDEVDEAWRNAENLRDTPRRVDQDSVEIDNEFRSLTVQEPNLTASQFSLDKWGDDQYELRDMKYESPQRIVHA